MNYETNTQHSKVKKYRQFRNVVFAAQNHITDRTLQASLSFSPGDLQGLQFEIDIYTLFNNTGTLQILLDETKAILKPIGVNVDHWGNTLLVVNKDWTQIRHYNLYDV